MKKNFQTAAMLIAFCLIIGSASVCRAQRMVGGYNSVSKTDAAVVDAELNIKSESTLTVWKTIYSRC